MGMRLYSGVVNDYGNLLNRLARPPASPAAAEVPVPAPAPEPAAARPIRVGPGAASEKQLSFIAKLLAERAGDPGAVRVGSKITAESSKADASNAITFLLGVPKCPGEASEVAAPVDPPVWPGTYTVGTPDDYRTFRVRVQAEDADFAPGETILEYLDGPDNETDYRSFAFVKPGRRIVVWKRHRDNAALASDAARFLADPEAALVSKHCARCNEKLTTPESLALGYGPVCAQKVGR